MAFCNQCGARNPEDAAYCGNCGSPGISLVPPSPAAAAVVFAQPQRRRLLKPVLWIMAGVISVSILIIALGVRNGVEGGVQETIHDELKGKVDQDNNVKTIRAVMTRDRDLSDAMSALINQTKINSEDDFDKIAALMRAYVEQAKKIDTSACPRDFAEAYYRHISAWSDEATAVHAHPHIPTGDESFVEGFYRGLAGDPTGGAGELRDELKAWAREVTARDAEVHKSWEEVEALAVRYGA